ncbi:regulator [Serratia marcescens]|nr:regulator [Serratia marcescens]
MSEEAINRIDKMQSILRNMKSDMKRQQKLSAINSMELTPKQANKRNADADWIAMEQIKRRHELHALSVELGFAERRDNYRTIELTDGWHRFNYQPREPN